MRKADRQHVNAAETLTIGADHAGFAQKEALKRFLTARGVPVNDIGAHAYDAADDFPDIARTLARLVARSKRNRGILLCGSGQGMCIAANKIKGVRAASAWDEKSAQAARHDDDVNVLCLGGRMHSLHQLKKILVAWLDTPFSDHARHRRRIKKIE